VLSELKRQNLSEVVVECPTCGAKFSVPETVTTTECPYCGTVFNVKLKEEVGINHFYFPLSKRDPYDSLLRFIECQYGVPADIRRNSTIVRGTLYMVPVYFYHIHGKARVLVKSRKLKTFSTTVEEVDDIGIVAIKGRLSELLEDYPFPIRGKKFFEERVKEMGVYYSPEIGREEAERIASTKLSERLRKEARELGEKVESFKEETFKVEFKGLVHYPIWEIEYEYDGERYRAYVDGATNVVIRAEHPLSLKGRITQTGLGALLIVTGIIAALLIIKLGVKDIAKLFGALASFIAGVVGSLPLFTRSVRRKIIASEIEITREKEEKLTKWFKTR